METAQPSWSVSEVKAKLTLATRTVRDFEGLGVALMNPWQE